MASPGPSGSGGGPLPSPSRADSELEPLSQRAERLVNVRYHARLPRGRDGLRRGPTGGGRRRARVHDP